MPQEHKVSGPSESPAGISCLELVNALVQNPGTWDFLEPALQLEAGTCNDSEPLCCSRSSGRAFCDSAVLFGDSVSGP